MTRDDVTDFSVPDDGENDAMFTSSSSSMADFDEAIYRPYLDGLDLTEAQACEFLRVVWSIMRMFVDLNLPVDSCGQIIVGLIEQASHELDSVE